MGPFYWLEKYSFPLTPEGAKALGFKKLASTDAISPGDIIEEPSGIQNSKSSTFVSKVDKNTSCHYITSLGMRVWRAPDSPFWDPGCAIPKLPGNKIFSKELTLP